MAFVVRNRPVVIPIKDYCRGLTEAGSAHVKAVDRGSDLNPDAKSGDKAACCLPPDASMPSLTGVVACLCTPKPAAVVDWTHHVQPAVSLPRYDVNDDPLVMRVGVVP